MEVDGTPTADEDDLTPERFSIAYPHPLSAVV